MGSGTSRRPGDSTSSSSCKMIELPAGGLKWKIGQRGSIMLENIGYDLIFAQDSQTWKWHFSISIDEPALAGFDAILHLAKALRDAGHREVRVTRLHRPNDVFAIAIPQELEYKITLS